MFSDLKERVEYLERRLGQRQTNIYGVDRHEPVMVRLRELESAIERINTWVKLMEKKVGVTQVLLDNGEVTLLNTKQEPARGWVDVQSHSE